MNKERNTNSIDINGVEPGLFRLHRDGRIETFWPRTLEQLQEILKLAENKRSELGWGLVEWGAAGGGLWGEASIDRDGDLRVLNHASARFICVPQSSFPQLISMLQANCSAGEVDEDPEDADDDVVEYDWGSDEEDEDEDGPYMKGAGEVDKRLAMDVVTGDWVEAIRDGHALGLPSMEYICGAKFKVLGRGRGTISLQANNWGTSYSCNAEDFRKIAVDCFQPEETPEATKNTHGPWSCLENPSHDQTDVSGESRGIRISPSRGVANIHSPTQAREIAARILELVDGSDESRNNTNKNRP